jgi:hypothetical protein
MPRTSRLLLHPSMNPVLVHIMLPPSPFRLLPGGPNKFRRELHPLKFRTLIERTFNNSKPSVCQHVQDDDSDDHR